MFALGQCKFLTGSIEEAIPLVESAIRLSPRDPALVNWYIWIGRVHMLQSRTDEAILWLEKALSINPGFETVHVSLAAAYGLKGDTDRAGAELAKPRRLNCDNRYSSIARLRAARFWGYQRFVRCTRPPTSPVSAKRGCRRSAKPVPSVVTTGANALKADAVQSQQG